MLIIIRFWVEDQKKRAKYLFFLFFLPESVIVDCSTRVLLERARVSQEEGSGIICWIQN